MAPPEAKLVCRNIWKLFGHGAQEFLTRHGGNPSLEDIQSAGLVAAARAVDITVGEGEIFVIMGLSGSGKSTLVRCLSRLIEPTAGEILFHGENLLTASDSRMIEIRRHKMGMVFQSFGLLPHRTVLQNVAFPLEMRGQDAHTRRERALEVIRLVGLEGREDYFPRELSGGQQQRVGIARSLVIEPDIWFLDEPFSALDPLIRREMQNEFLRLRQMLRKTIVFITHDFDEALRLADRIAIMKNGAVEQCDTPAQIVLNPATDYVRKFTEVIDKSRVVRAQTLVVDGLTGQGVPVDAGASVHDLAKLLIQDTRETLPVALDGRIIGAMHRQQALGILVGAE